MYNILGIMKGLNDNAKTEQLNESVKQSTVYETVEPKGSIMEAVKSLEGKYAEFKEGIEDKIEAAREKAAAKGKIKDTAKEEPKSASRFVKGKAYGGSAQKDAEEKDDLDEGAKPDFLDVDKDGDKKEPFKKAVKDKKAVKESTDASAQKGAQAILQALSPEEEQELAAVVKRAGNNPAAVVKALGITPELIQQAEQGQVAEGIAPTLGGKVVQALYTAGLLGTTVGAIAAGSPYLGLIAAPLLMAAGTIYGGAKGQVGHNPEQDVQEGQGPYELYNPKHPKFKANHDKWMAKNPGKTLSDFIAAMRKREHGVNEVAPPGAKAERMVKHIKKGYAKDGKLTKKEKGIAYATAWKAHNKGQVEEGVEFGDTVKNSSTKFKKAKVVKEARDMTKSQYFDEQVALALASEQPGLDTSSPKFNEAVYNEIIAQGMTAKAARNIMLLDEDFLGDVATAYGYFCKHNDEVAAHAQGSMQEPIDAVQEPVDAMQELDEIARLAGLTTEMDNKVPADSDSPLTHAGCPICEMDPCRCDHDVEEGNAFTGKLAATPKGGNFKLGDRAYKDTSNLEEEEMEEGNEFSGALAAAKASGAKEFEVDGKRYTVKEDITLTADGEDVINLFRKLSGLDPVASPVDVAQPAQPDAGVQVVPDIQDVIAGQEEVAEDESDPKQRDIEYVNTPREEQAGADASFPSGTDLNRAKRMYKRASPGDNPMAVKEAALWEKYESMISDIKK